MASITKRGKSWQYTVSNYVGGEYKPIRKGGFSTKKEASVAAAQVESELSRGLIVNTEPVIFVKHFIQWIEDTKSNHAIVTKQRYLNTASTLESYFGHKSIQSMTKQSYKRFLDEYGQSHAKDTIRKLNTHIRACVKDAIDDGLIRTDFTRGVSFNSKVETKSIDMKFLNFNETKALLRDLQQNSERSPLYMLLILGIQSGMRFAEMLGLKRSDFDFSNNTINVERSMDYKRGTGFAKLKNDQSKRIIDMDNWTMNLFKQYFKNTPANILGLVFFNYLSKSGTFTNAAANKILKKALERLDLTHITVHGLRHTHISILLYKGISIHYVSKRAGHKSIQTTIDYYAHVLKELHEQEVKATKAVMNEMTAV